MLRRSAVLAGSLAATFPFAASRVEASDKTETKEPSSTVKASQLSLYDNPPATQYEFIEEEIGQFRQIVSKVRKASWNFMDSIKDTTDVAKDKFEIGKAHTSNLLYRIQEDTGVVGRSVIIVLAGLGGTVLGYRSGYGRRAFYAASGMVSAAAICYPNEAVDIARTGWKQVVDVYEQFVPPTPTDVKKPSQASAEKKVVAAASSPKEDHGMSNPEDKDMYTTRGS